MDSLVTDIPLLTPEEAALVCRDVYAHRDLWRARHPIYPFFTLGAASYLDARQARRVIRVDDEVDRLNSEIIADLIASMEESPATVEQGLSLFSAIRHLERIADHATNIAEDVVYLVEGEIVRHRPMPVELE